MFVICLLPFPSFEQRLERRVIHTNLRVEKKRYPTRQSSVGSALATAPSTHARAIDQNTTRTRKRNHPHRPCAPHRSRTPRTHARTSPVPRAEPTRVDRVAESPIATFIAQSSRAHTVHAYERARVRTHAHAQPPHATPTLTSLSNAGGAGAASPLASTLLASLTARVVTVVVVTRIAARRFARPAIVVGVVAGACARIMEDIIPGRVRWTSRNGASTTTGAPATRQRQKKQRSFPWYVVCVF